MMEHGGRGAWGDDDGGGVTPTLGGLAAAVLLALVAPSWTAAAPSTRIASSLPQERGDEGELVIGSWLVLEAVEPRGRRPFREEPVFGRYLLDPRSAPPIVGERVSGSLGEKRWSTREAHGDRPAAGTPFAWAYGELVVPRDLGGVYVARLSGAFDGWIDGVPFAGDGYGYGLLGVPIRLDEGVRPVFVSGIRGSFNLSFHRLDQTGLPLVADVGDAALPDVGPDDVGAPILVGLPLHSAASHWLGRVRIAVRDGGDFEAGPAGSVSGLAPFAVRRAVLSVVPKPIDDERPRRLPLSITTEGDESSLAIELVLQYRDERAPRLRTYLSSVDGAVVPFGLLAPSSPITGTPGLVVALHGASVGARAKIQSYSPKPAHWIAAPTNRRPFGFDWQDWGRRDAFDVIRTVERDLGSDPARRTLTGHSMGGHGVWHLAAWDAGAFAAAAPSAGWQSFDTYGGPRPEGALRDLWHAADRGSEVARAAEALARLPWYVLHGDADEVVPVREAQDMVRILAEAGARHVDFHFESGAGHWWDGDAADGADCVDWPPLFDVLVRARRDLVGELCAWPLENDDRGVERLLLERPDGGSPDERWLEVSALAEPGRVGRYSGRVRHDGKSVRLELATHGIRAFEFRPQAAAGEAPRRVELALDGQVFAFTADQLDRVWALRRSRLGAWQRLVDADTAIAQRPGASGPFKRVFDRRPVLVVGTAGRASENAEVLAAARFDAGRWNVRAAGDLEIARDTDVLDPKHAPRFAGRNLVLYGNREQNAAFDTFLVDAPFEMRRGRAALGEGSARTTWRGTALASLGVQPRRDENAGGALVGWIAGSGPLGTRLAHLGAWMVSGVGLPDVVLYDATTLARADHGVLAAGFWRDDFGAGEFRAPTDDASDP